MMAVGLRELYKLNAKDDIIDDDSKKDIQLASYLNARTF